jgi:hypothetical protein
MASGLLDPTPGAPLSLIDGSAGGLGAHDLAQGGQLEKANVDKRAAGRVLTTCDDEWSAAVRGAAPRRKILGIF